MKNKPLIFIVTCMFLISNVSAQIPNAGFELWHTDDIGVLVPDDWQLTVPTWYVGTCYREDGFVGDYCVQLHDNMIAGNTAPGAITASFPLSERPAMLKGMWSYQTIPGVSISLDVHLFLWDEQSQMRISIGEGSKYVGGDIDWEQVSVPITYSSALLPDSAIIFISSGSLGGYPNTGSHVYVDDLYFEGTTSLSELAAGPAITIGPNPVQDVLFGHADWVIEEVTLLDMTGRSLRTSSVRKCNFEIPMSGLANGSYLVKMVFSNGSSTVRRFMKR